MKLPSAVFRSAAGLGIDPARVAVGGDSAGGHVAALAALRAPGSACAQLLAYPALDPLMDSASYAQFADGPMLTAAEMAGAWSAYLGGGGQNPGRARVSGGGLARTGGIGFCAAREINGGGHADQRHRSWRKAW